MTLENLDMTEVVHAVGKECLQKVALHKPHFKVQKHQGLLLCMMRLQLKEKHVKVVMKRKVFIYLPRQLQLGFYAPGQGDSVIMDL